MRELVACMAAAALLAGCTSRYTVRSDDWTEAQARAAGGEEDGLVPARADGTRPTWLEIDEVTRVEEGAGPDYLEITARDPRTALRWSGWYFAVGGVVLGTMGLAAMHRREADPYDRMGGAGIALLSVPYLALGTGLLLGGYLSDGPEEAGPAPK